MIREKIIIREPAGIDLRLAGVLCEKAIEYSSEITLKRGKTSANAKSLLSVLGACIKCEDEIELICSGDDEIAAHDELCSILRRKEEKDN